jgi:hypothetical protein
MKPQNIGLLVAGATLAAGLAVKMTQPQPVPVAAQAAPTAKPLVVPAQMAKPSPIPDALLPDPAPAAAPAPVYREPPKQPIRKNKPILLAEVEKEPPTQWAPGRYEASIQSLPQPTTPQSATPQPTTAPEPVAPPAPLEQIAPRQAVLRTGTTISIRLEESLSGGRNGVGDTFQASLAEPLVVEGLVIAERGARVTGKIVDSREAGRVSGTSLLELELSTLTTSDGQRVAISTDPWTKQGDTSHREDAEKIGGGAALGAIIGAIAGGGAGAAIGAGIGGGAGVGTVIATRGKPVNIPTETIIRFRLATRVTITEQQIARQ